MKTMLITGFDPFGGETVNPAWEAVALLPETLGEYRLHKLRIPTQFTAAAEAVLARAEALAPAVILCVGQAGGRSDVTPERIAVNIRDARIPDNRGFRPTGERILPTGPAAYFSTLPVETMAEAIRAAGLPGSVSNTAGTFVCNDTLYRLLHAFSGAPTRVGFIHVPYLPRQAAAKTPTPPSLPLEEIARALRAAIEVC